MKSAFLLTAIFIQHFLFCSLAEDGKNKIIGGQEVKPKGRYPFQVAMIDSNGNQYCGGSLVNKDWVLCAAHCHGYGSKVYIGRHDLSDSSESYESIEVELETKHPNYNGQTLDNDFMMVKLKRSSSYTPVKLDSGSTNISAGVDVTVMGWGTTSFQGSSSDVLMEVEVDIVSNSDCNNDYNDGITKNMLCAARNKKDSCQGDSGGPLIVKGSDMSGDVQVGVVSWGNGCADPNYPGVYARVSSQITWINEQINSGENNNDDSSGGSNDENSGSSGDDNLGGGGNSGDNSEGNDDDVSGGGSVDDIWGGGDGDDNLGGGSGYYYSGGGHDDNYSGGGNEDYYWGGGSGDDNRWGGGSDNPWWMDLVIKLLN